MRKYYIEKTIKKDGLPRETGKYFTNKGLVFLDSHWKKADGITFYLEPVKEILVKLK